MSGSCPRRTLLDADNGIIDGKVAVFRVISRLLRVARRLQ